jgi:hypothetical protein
MHLGRRWVIAGSALLVSCGAESVTHVRLARRAPSPAAPFGQRPRAPERPGREEDRSRSPRAGPADDGQEARP